MGIQGKLTKEKMAHTMPLDSPAYNKKPFHYRGAKFYNFSFETDASAAAELIPPQVTLSDPATATLMFVEYPWSTIGKYKEAILSVGVTYKGENYHYLTHLILDSCEAILVGREIYGIPKKMGEIEFTEQGDVIAGYVERPKGIRIASGVFRTESPLPSAPDGTLLRTLSLRTIPSPEKDTDHSSVELIETNAILSSMKMWSGTGSCEIPNSSVIDPWSCLPVKKMLGSNHMITDIILGEGKIVETF